MKKILLFPCLFLLASCNFSKQNQASFQPTTDRSYYYFSIANDFTQCSVSKTMSGNKERNLFGVSKNGLSFYEWTYSLFTSDEELDSEKSENTQGKTVNIGDQTIQVSYFKYTFFVSNNSKAIVDLNFSLTAFENDKSNGKSSLLDTTRIMIYDNDANTNNHDKEIYAKESASINYTRDNAQTTREFVAQYPVSKIEDDEHPLVSESFISNTTLINKQLKNFNPGEIRRYTVVIWFEGEDPQSNNETAPTDNSISFGVDLSEKIVG